MALQNYNDLLTAVPKFVNKRALDGMAGDFIALTESDIQSKLRTREMQVKVEAPVTCASVNLPLDWLDATRLWIDGHHKALDYCTQDALEEMRGCQGGMVPGYPTHYSLADNVIELAPVPTTELSLWMTYYAKIPTLSVERQTNWLTARDIGVYLYGALVRASPYLLDDARVATWANEYTARIQQLNVSSQVALHSGAPLVRRRQGYRPGRQSFALGAHGMSGTTTLTYGAFSDYLENSLLNHVFGSTAYTRPAGLWVALYTTAATDAAPGAEPPAGVGYARLPVTFTAAPAQDDGSSAMWNSAVLQFAAATGAWGTLIWCGVHDALTGGNLLAHGQLFASKSVTAGDAVRFPANQILVGLN